MEVKSISAFQVHCAEDLSAAYGSIVYWNGDGMKDTIKLPLISAWANPRTHKCIRAHFKLELFRPEHKAMYDGLTIAAEGLPVIDENLTMMAWRKGSMSLVRYGAVGRSYAYNDRDTSQSLSYFTCKQIMIREFIDFLRKWNPVAGTELVDFSVVKDDWLESVGAIKLPDILHRSVPMWMADFGHIIRETTVRHNFGMYGVEKAAKIMLSELQKQIGG